MSDVILLVVRNVRDENGLNLTHLVIIGLIGFKQFCQPFSPALDLCKIRRCHMGQQEIAGRVRFRRENLTNLLSGHSFHAGGWSSGPGKELVDKQTWETVTSAEIHRLLKVCIRLRWEATDDVRRDGNARHTKETLMSL